MPKVTVYIRNEDLDKWRAIKKKTGFIHNALNARKQHLEKQLARVETKMVDDLVNTPKIIATPIEAKTAVMNKFKSFSKDQSTGFISKSFSARGKK